MPGERVPPPGWKGEALTEFFDLARSNQFGTFHNKPRVVHDICRLDRAFAAALFEWRDPPDLCVALLFARGHAAYRAAASLTLATQCAEAPALLRLCLECAGYAALLHDDAGLAETWLRRDDSQDDKKAVRRAFTSQSIETAIKQRDAHHAEVFRSLYETLIDFGAHPNEKMVSSNLQIAHGTGEARINIDYLQADGPTLDVTLKWLVQVGIWALHAFALLYPARAAAANLQTELTDIKQRY